MSFTRSYLDASFASLALLSRKEDARYRIRTSFSHSPSCQIENSTSYQDSYCLNYQEKNARHQVEMSFASLVFSPKYYPTSYHTNRLRCPGSIEHPTSFDLDFASFNLISRPISRFNSNQIIKKPKCMHQPLPLTTTTPRLLLHIYSLSSKLFLE